MTLKELSTNFFTCLKNSAKLFYYSFKFLFIDIKSVVKARIASFKDSTEQEYLVYREFYGSSCITNAATAKDLNVFKVNKSKKKAKKKAKKVSKK